MATVALDTDLPTLIDIANLKLPGGAIANVVEAMTKRSPMLQSMVWKEGNLETGHKTVSRTALPTLAWRRLNEGVPASKSRTQPVTETCGQLAGISQVDVDMARLAGNPAAYRASEDKAFIASFHNELESAFIYSSQKATPEQVHGLAPRLAAISGNDYGGQIVDSQIASGGSDQTSMWFVVWSPQTVYGIYPKNLPTGIQFTDTGQQWATDGAGNKFLAYMTDWKWNCGICVEDARYLVRLANIDTSAIVGTGKLLIEDMVSAYHAMRDWNSGRGAIYCNRTIAQYLHLQALDTVKNATLSIDMIGGKPVTSFLGIPIYVTDGILNTEDIIT